jgi:hypothetical protein
MPKLTPAQQRAMDMLRDPAQTVEGKIYFGDGVSTATIRALANMGLVVVENHPYTYTNSRGRTRTARDWSARLAS